MSSGLEDRFQTLHEIVRAAKHRLPAGEWDYLTGGTETETTMRRNRLALDTIALRPRVLRNVSKVDATSTFLGRPVRIPVMFAPIGSIESFTPGGGATAAQASAEFGVPQMLSSVCSPGLEAVAKAADNFRIFQLYVRGDDAFVDDHVRRALAHGYAAFCRSGAVQEPTQPFAAGPSARASKGTGSLVWSKPFLRWKRPGATRSCCSMAGIPRSRSVISARRPTHSSCSAG